MKILCTADTHGFLPELDLKGIDLVLHAGDMTFNAKQDIIGQLAFFENQFCPWVRRILDRCPLFFTWGNHEMFAEKMSIRRDFNDVTERCLLNNSVGQVGNIRIYGTPYTPPFCDWAFNELDTQDGIGRRLDGHQLMGFQSVIDVVLSHGPPLGVLDFVHGDRQRVGSAELAKAIYRVKPQLVCFGHIHGQGGQQHADELMGIRYVNCSHVGEDYRPVNAPMVVEI